MAVSDGSSGGDPEPVDALFNESLSLFHKLGDDWGIAACLSGMGNRAFALGDYSRAAAVMDEGLAKARATGDAWLTAYLLHGLGHVNWMLGNLERSMALLAEGLLLCGNVGDRRGAAMCIQSFALIAGGHQLWERAARLWGAAAELRLAAGLMRWGQPWIRSPEGLTPFDAVDAARAALGEGAFTEAWTAGGALSLEAASAEAAALQTLLSSRANQPAGRQKHADSLTQRERQVAALVAQGLTNRQLGAALVITEGTAALHVKHVLAKLGFSTRAQIAAWASRQSEISSP
jgi:non-specific serine/threonine protein kinase